MKSKSNQNQDLFWRKFSLWGLWLNLILGLSFLYLPILVLVIFSFNQSKSSFVWRGFTLDWYEGLFQGLIGGKINLSQDLWSALGNSLIIGGISTIIATVLGTMIALALEKHQFPGKIAIEGLLFLPIVIPDITMGISLLVFFSLLFQFLQTLLGIRFVLGLSTVIIGHIAFNISYVAVTVRGKIAELDPALEEVAWDLGANEWQTLKRVTLPLIFPGILSGALLAFTLSLDDFVVTFFTAGVGQTTLPVFVYGMIKKSVSPAINAISTLMFMVSFLLVISSLTLNSKQ